MDKEDVVFKLETINLDRVRLDVTDKANFENLEFSVELGYKEEEKDYLEKSLVNLRVHILGGMEGAPVDVILYSTIGVSKNDQPYIEFVEAYMNELAKPILNKASSLISNLYSDVRMLPTIIDLYSEYFSAIKE